MITTKILTRNLITGFLFFVIVSSISLSVLQSTNSANEQRMTNDENDLYHVNSLTNETSLTTSKPLPGKEYIEYYQADFLSVYGNTMKDVTIVFEDNVIWNFPDLSFNYQYKYLNGFKATISESLFDFLEDKPFVKYLYENVEYDCTAFDDNLNWGIDDIDAERVWGGAENANDVISGYPTGDGVKVAIIDSGIDYDHTDLDANYVCGYDFAGINETTDNNPFEDTVLDGVTNSSYGHGTAVAGIIGAEDNGNDIIGVAPEADLYALKIWGATWNSTSEEYEQFYGSSAVENSIEWAIDNDMDIISMSFGGLPYDLARLELYSLAYSKGITLIAAAGNAGVNTTLNYPAAYSPVIQVGAVDKNWELWVKSDGGSNWGVNQEFVATAGAFMYTTEPGGGTWLKRATSIACPMVSGTCALLHSITPNIMPEEIRYILRNSATDLNASGWDQYTGWGLINASAAVEYANSTDSDSDGIINSLEVFVWGTDPYDSDSDNDGLNDADEVRIYLSDPNDNDTDKDTLNDYDEVYVYGTEPAEADSDSDGYHDQIELLLDYDPYDFSHHPQQSFLFENGDGDDHTWTATDSPYNTVTENHTKDDYDTIRNIETTSHVGNGQYAICAALDLTDWNDDNNLHITLRYRSTSTYLYSSVTQFRIKFYDDDISDYITFDNPTDYATYYVKQNNRNGQTWISGTDSGWQNATFTLLSSDFEDFVGTDDRLFIHWGHHDSWASYYNQTEYLDYLMVSEEDNGIEPDQPRNLLGVGDTVSNIIIYWKSPLNVKADEYIIYRKVSGVYTWQATVSHSGVIEDLQYWTDESLSTGVTYYYRVCAVNDEIEGAYSYWSGHV